MGLSRQQRRALERERFKTTKKMVSNQIEIAKRIGGDTQILEMAEWVQRLSSKEIEYCNTLCREHTKAHLKNFSVAFQEVIKNLLIDEGYENHEEIMVQITDDVEDTGLKVNKIEDEGGNYYMSLNQDKEKIIECYKEKIQEGWSEKEALKETMTMFKKYSKSSVKNIIKTNCRSNTCPMQNRDGNCGNNVVIEEKEKCVNYEKVEEPVTAITEEKSKKQLCFDFFDKNKRMEKTKMIQQASDRYGLKYSSVETYQRSWRKERFINKDFEEAPEVKQEVKEEKKMGLKVLKKVVVLDLEGQCGKYHVEANKVTKNDIIFTTIEYVDKYYKAEEEEITKRLVEIKKSKEELKQVIREYVEV